MTINLGTLKRLSQKLLLSQLRRRVEGGEGEEKVRKKSRLMIRANQNKNKRQRRKRKKRRKKVKIGRVNKMIKLT